MPTWSARGFTAIGTLSSVVLGFFDPEAKQYARIPIHEQVEVLSLLGNVAQHDGKPKVHAHVVVGKRDGTAWRPPARGPRPAHSGSHADRIPGHLERHADERTGLALLKTD